MKRIFMLLASVCLSMPALAAQSSIVFTWGNGNPGVPSCSSSVTKSCLVSDTITDTTVSGSPVVLSSTISPTATTYTTPLPKFTTTKRTYTLVVNYKDENGAAQATSAATATVTVAQPFVANPPTGFSATAQ